MSKGWQLDFGDHILGSPQIPIPFHSHMVKIWTPKVHKYGPQRSVFWVSHKKCEKVASMRTYNPTKALEASSLLPTKRTARNHIKCE